MLIIFDECKAAQGSWRVLADVLLSAAKQQILYRSTPVPRSAPLYSEIDWSPHLARRLGVAALSAALITSVWIQRRTEAPASGTVIRPEAIYWFPIIPQGRYCYGPPKRTGKPEIVLTTGAWVRGTPEAPEYWTVVRSQTGFWISTTVPWGQYCLDVPEGTGRPEGVL